MLSLIGASHLQAESYLLPLSNRDSVVGSLQYATTNSEDTLLDIARRYGFGYEEIVQSNPTIDRWVPGESSKVLLPGRFVLPKT